jgi:NADH-quinone oxidoreductase subunit F
MGEGQILLARGTVATLEDYVELDGGTGLRRALDLEPRAVREEIARSGLRGRGGAGFPTGTKWQSVVEGAANDSTVYLVCNAAEGEPGTFKDRVLMRRNPYQILEGILIGLHATAAAHAYIGLKHGFQREAQRLHDALDDLVSTGWEGAERVTILEGPDEYLFGEESAMLEVIEHKLPLPRILPPYMQGLFATMHQPNPTVVNNAETFAHVGHIMANGADWFRTFGTEETPGTMLFTVIGDVQTPGVYELPMGTPLRTLVCDIAGARDVQAIYAGTSNTVITPSLLDLPMDFDSFQEAGTGLGSGGYVVYDASRCMVQVTAALSHFLGIESCGQCPPCKLHGMAIAELLERLVRGEGTARDIEDIRKRCALVTEANRCYLPVGHALLVQSTLDAYPKAFEARLEGPCPPDRFVGVPKIVDIDDATGAVTLDDNYRRKRSDWSYAPPGEDADLADVRHPGDRW